MAALSAKLPPRRGLRSSGLPPTVARRPAPCCSAPCARGTPPRASRPGRSRDHGATPPRWSPAIAPGGSLVLNSVATDEVAVFRTRVRSGRNRDRSVPAGCRRCRPLRRRRPRRPAGSRVRRGLAPAAVRCPPDRRRGGSAHRGDEAPRDSEPSSPSFPRRCRMSIPPTGETGWKQTAGEASAPLSSRRPDPDTRVAFVGASTVHGSHVLVDETFAAVSIATANATLGGAPRKHQSGRGWCDVIRHPGGRPGSPRRRRPRARLLLRPQRGRPVHSSRPLRRHRRVRSPSEKPAPTKLAVLRHPGHAPGTPASRCTPGPDRPPGPRRGRLLEAARTAAPRQQPRGHPAKRRARRRRGDHRTHRDQLPVCTPRAAYDPRAGGCTRPAGMAGAWRCASARR